MWRAAVVAVLLEAALAGAQWARGAPGQRWRELSRTSVDEPALALAFVGSDRALALSPGSVSLWKLEGIGLRREARTPWPAATAARHPGGLIVGRAGEPLAWLLSTHHPRARLVRVDGSRLFLGEEADAVPWPGAAEGLRFRPGTNVLDGLLAGGAPAPLVALDAVSGAVVRDDGMLFVDGASAAVRVGSAIASPWPGLLIAGAADPPSAEDTLLVLDIRRGAWQVDERFRIAGTLRALAVRAEESAAEVVAGVSAAGRFELLRLRFRRRP